MNWIIFTIAAEFGLSFLVQKHHFAISILWEVMFSFTVAEMFDASCAHTLPSVMLSSWPHVPAHACVQLCWCFFSHLVFSFAEDVRLKTRFSTLPPAHQYAPSQSRSSFLPVSPVFYLFLRLPSVEIG